MMEEITEKQKNNFFKKFKQGNPDECWEWLASKFKFGVKSGKGAGCFKLKIRNKNEQYAHRISYEFFIGPIPEGLKVLHKCDNPPCVNPNHLFLGTQKDNIEDCVKKGRNAKGEKNGMFGRRGKDHPMFGSHPDQHEEQNNNVKLNWKKVEEIRSSNLSNKELAKIYNVSLSNIYTIKGFGTWRNVR